MHLTNNAINNLTKTTPIHQKAIFQVILGSVFIALMAQIAVPLPFTPVPMTLQSLAISLLIVFLKPNRAFFAVLAYLCEATCGIPVLAGGVSNALWFIGPKAGYLCGFLVSSYVLPKILEYQKSVLFLKTWLIFSLNELIILTMGSMVLSIFVGLENALLMGLLPFLPGAFLKISIAASTFRARMS